jgi:hypothetical protein
LRQAIFTRRGRAALSLLCCCTALLASCSDDDHPAGDAGGANLWQCATPGMACNAHDPCAINPVCGEDLFCHPAALTDCDDGLSCTVDSCSAPGLCAYEAAEGACLLKVEGKGGLIRRCFDDGDVSPDDPCKVCDADRDQAAWSERTGGKCDDKAPCTVNDTCQAGICKGQYYGTKCDDGLSCTKDLCDGKGGCKNELRAGHCKIAGRCYQGGYVDPLGCVGCVPKKSQTGWTTLQDVCKIGAACFAAKAQDASGCGVCDPTKSTSAWTPVAGKCLIEGSCHASGAKDASGCRSCDPAQDASGWTLAAGKCLIRGSCHDAKQTSPSGCGVCDPAQSTGWWTVVSGASSAVTGFEGSLGGYTVGAKVGGVGWQLSTKRARSGKGSLYYGDPKSGDYDAGGLASKGTATSAAIALPAGQKAALHFWVYMDTESRAKFDVLTVSVGGVVAWTKSPTGSMPPGDYRQWVPVAIDLTSHAGSSVTIGFSFDTVDAWLNQTEGVYLDDVTIITSCGS